jgi:hypothetical protein
MDLISTIFLLMAWETIPKERGLEKKSGKIVMISNFRGNIAPGGNTDSGTGIIILPVLQAGHTESISLVDQFPEKKLQRKGRGIRWRLPGFSADSSTHIGPLR